LKKKSCQQLKPRIPLKVDGIQVNFCKNPLCDNYGVPASVDKQPRGRNTQLKERDSYTLVGSGRHVPMLHCHKCGEYPTLKSNKGIAEEVDRMHLFLCEKKVSCPHGACANHDISIDAGKTYYSSFGKTSGGSQRFKCKSCNKIFTIRKPTAGQRTPHKNKTVFSLLMNKVPFNRICEVADINPKTLYDKINFIHKQCQAFVSEREHKLVGKHLERVYVSTDRQEYVVNWTKRNDKRNVKLTAIGSADNLTGYVFGMHLNYDSAMDAMDIEEKALVCDDYNTAHPFREYARIWLQGDYDEAVQHSATNKLAVGLGNQITNEYNEAIQREDVEASEITNNMNRLPAKGVQIHSEYTMYGHFHYLHELLANTDKVRFFLDQDSGIRAACLSAFQREVSNRTCDAFYVRINKDLTVDDKRKVLRESRKAFKAVQAQYPDLTENEVKLIIIKQRMETMQEIGKWKDRWLLHPFPNMSEPEKAICYLTNYGDYDEDHQAWLYNKASMHAIDCFFMQVRRRLSLLERPIASASSVGRMWHGYSAYNPAVIVKLLDIFRVYYNYCLAGKDKQTPAMRIGLAKGVVPLEDIIYYRQGA
jgi:transposase-like protein